VIDENIRQPIFAKLGGGIERRRLLRSKSQLAAKIDIPPFPDIAKGLISWRRLKIDAKYFCNTTTTVALASSNVISGLKRSFATEIDNSPLLTNGKENHITQKHER
jgi:hypothetical protein